MVTVPYSDVAWCTAGGTFTFTGSFPSSVMMNLPGCTNNPIEVELPGGGGAFTVTGIVDETDPTCRVCFCVTGCGGPVVGATVSVSGGPSGITRINGCVVLDVGSAGTYTVTVTAPGFNDYSQSLDLQCGVQTKISLTPASGYLCCAELTGCPIPSTDLFLSDSILITTAVSVPYDPVTNTWHYTKNVPFFQCSNCVPASGNIDITWTLDCAGKMTVSTTANPGLQECLNPLGTAKLSVPGTLLSSSCPPTFLLHYTIRPIGPFGNGLGQVYGCHATSADIIWSS
jgi:hypothetical protein